MKILVISDIHGCNNTAQEIITENNDVKHIIFLGDGMNTINQIETFFPEKSFYCVAGNCDFITATDENFLSFGGKNIFFTHGHKYYVKQQRDLSLLKERAKSIGADIALFGHTHVPHKEIDGELYLMNPGAVQQSSYGIIEIKDGEIILDLRSV